MNKGGWNIFGSRCHLEPGLFSMNLRTIVEFTTEPEIELGSPHNQKRSSLFIIFYPSNASNFKFRAISRRKYVVISKRNLRFAELLKENLKNLRF